MRLTLAVTGFICSLALLLACGSDPPDEPPVRPSPTPTTVVPTPTPRPVPEGELTREQFEGLQPAASATYSGPTALTWRLDGAAVYVSSSRGVWTLGRDGEAGELTVNEPEAVLAVSPAGLAATTADQRSVTLRDIEAGDAVGDGIALDYQLATAAFSPDGSRLAVASAETIAVRIYDVASGDLVEEVSGFETAAPAYGVRFGPSGAGLIWHARADFQVYDLESDSFGPPMAASDFLAAFALDPLGTTIATSAGGLLSFWDTHNGQPVDEIRPSDPVLALDFTPSGSFLAAGGDQGISFLQMPLASEIAGLDAGARLLAFSPEGDAIASADEAGAVTIWLPE